MLRARFIHLIFKERFRRGMLTNQIGNIMGFHHTTPNKEFLINLQKNWDKNLVSLGRYWICSYFSLTGS